MERWGGMGCGRGGVKRKAKIKVNVKRILALRGLMIWENHRRGRGRRKHTSLSRRGDFFPRDYNWGCRGDLGENLG